MHAIITAAVLAFIAYTQHAIIDAVLKRDGQLDVRTFYAAFVALICVSVAAARST